MEQKQEKETKKKEEEEAKPAAQTLRWDDSKMTSTYANVCNVFSTREEVTLLFGTNQTWHGAQQELTVQLSDRIILNPFTAKRLSMMLNNVIKEYESRFGELKIDGK
ncbi:DUF3467 domain-containing protein [uncultured Desulfobacter sp.]|uniref:DUF3467 domain-containing protein n=1 Tax=uncultured Desulfobacter sp. TaxID=240139 RepID=UPI002AA67C95|nr:DUF3467 domain-containing protein [uncultured Desulfobacter sp.]